MEERARVTDGPVGGGRGHCRQRRGTNGGFRQASMWWVRWERHTTCGWREGVVYSMGTFYHTMGLANGPGKRPHCLPVVLPPVPDHSASSASWRILIQQAYHFLLMYKQNTACQKYAARRIGPRHIERNLNIGMAIIQNGADLIPVEKNEIFSDVIAIRKEIATNTI